MSRKGRGSPTDALADAAPQRPALEDARDEDQPEGLIFVILVLLAFLAVALVLFGSGWLQVNV